MMLQEAGEFANHLKKIEKDIRSLKNATEGAAQAGLAVVRPQVAVARRCGPPPTHPHTRAPAPQACSCRPRQC